MYKRQSYNHRAEGGFTVSAQDKDLFTNMKNLVPGDVVENTVDITNNSSQSLTFYVKAYPDFTASGEGARRDGGPLVTEEGKEFQSDLLDIMKMNITSCLLYTSYRKRFWRHRSQFFPRQGNG